MSMKLGVLVHIFLPRMGTWEKKIKSSKFTVVDVRHIEIRLLVTYQRFIVRLTRNMVRGNRITLGHMLHDQNKKFRKFKMAEGRYFENDVVAISQPRIIRI